MTTWSSVSSESTTYTNNATDIVYDESGTTYDTLATYYDGDTKVEPIPQSWSTVSSESTEWS